MLPLALLLPALLLVVAACAPAQAPERVLGPDDLPRSGGCGDVILYAATEADTVLVLVNWPAAAERAQIEGGYSAEVALPAPGVEVTLRLGQRLSTQLCTDVIVDDGPRVVGEAPALEGTAELHVAPENGDPTFPLGRATLVLTDVVFEFGSGDAADTWRIERLELHDVQVGWLPG